VADYIEVSEPTTRRTRTAGGTITGGQLVYVSGANTVQATSAATGAWAGIATQDATSGNKVGVISGNEQELTAAATIAAGDVLIPAASGQVTPIGAGTTYSQVVGVALTGGASGAKVRVQMAR
jgi:hypothetical protein